jgi:hypothetical protein
MATYRWTKASRAKLSATLRARHRAIKSGLQPETFTKGQPETFTHTSINRKLVEAVKDVPLPTLMYQAYRAGLVEGVRLGLEVANND